MARIHWIGLALVAALAVTGCKKEPSSASVSRRDVEGYLVLEGRLVTPPTDYATVLPTYNAPVEKVMVTVGKWVNEGEVLLTLQFANMQAWLEQARQRVKAAETAYANARQTYDDEVKRLDAELKSLRSLQAQGEDVSTQIQIVEQQLAHAREYLKANMAPYQADLDTARYNFQQAQSGAKLASIRAPISGTVLTLDAAPGQMIGENAKDPVATICDLGALVVHAPLSRDLVGTVEKDMPVSLTFEELAETFEGNVKRVETQSTEEGVIYVAVISFDNEKGLVKPGAKVKGAAVKVGEAENVLAVPTEAVDKDDTGRPVVNVLRNGEWVATVVEVGLSGGGWTEIKSGLNEGDTVQVTP
jgi:RND family efflux transporter MFP subunit